MSENEASPTDEAAQNPQGGSFDGPVGSVGNQGEQRNVAGSVGRDQVYVAGDYYEAQQPTSTTSPHNLPRSNAQFVGRQTEIERLHNQLQQNECLAISAIAGMGGIGKTELALQYAMSHLRQSTYPGGLLWLQARDADVGSQVIEFALSRFRLTPPDGLELPAQVEFCWQHWPNGEALVVFDDVTAYENVKPYLPPSEPRFKVLFTTRQHFSAVQELRLDVLNEAEAIQLLERLVGVERIQLQVEDAKSLCQWLGYLPLGLELVGRYLEGKPDLNLVKMKERLESKGLAARALTQAEAGMTGNLGVAAAFELSWQELDEAAQQLGALLSLFALAPIPWSLVESVVNELGDGAIVPSDVEELEELRDGVLFKRHLLQRTGKETYQLHQLIREFFSAKREQTGGIDVLKRGYCAAMVVVAQTIPQTPTRDLIAAVTPSIPHLGEATVLQDWLSDEDLKWPFIGLARYWHGQGAYAQTEPWLEQCLAAVRERLGEDHPDTAIALNNLAELYRVQGRYEEAEPLYKQALDIYRQQLGEEHSLTATSLNNLAALYDDQGRYKEAEPLYKQTLDIKLRVLGEDHPSTATSLNNLAALYDNQGRYSEAEPLYLQALDITRQQLGEEHPDTAQSLNNLAALYRSQGRYEAAEPLYLQALEIDKRTLGEDHPDTARDLNNLAALYDDQGRHEEAEPLYLQALDITRQQLGEDHPDTAISLNNLAYLYDSQGRYEEAEPLLIQALQIFEQRLGSDHPNTITFRNNLARLRSQQ